MTDTTKPASPTPSVDLQNRQQALLWRLVAACFGQGEKAQNLEALSKEIAKEVDVPDLVLDPMVSITTLTQRFPELRKDFETPLPGAMLDDESPGGVALTSANPDGSGNAAADSASDKDRLRRTLVLSKLLL
ncbi:MAG TPA: hypothetical protein PK493_13300, partial [Pseudomonadota bacterium]|nr:hypothetical protein [Pseudomonadota bacterium]